ncbi:MAG: hypothetical protein M1833_003497 [Piccolia ochrophora]|nr:MAG: hypothetical protein M1833_003497 [Piccolia ochrophora]
MRLLRPTLQSLNGFARMGRASGSSLCSSPRSFHRLAPSIPLHPGVSTPPRPLFRNLRHQSTSASVPTNPSEPTASPLANEREDQPAYQLTFTCKPCNKRSSHRVSKQGYHRGTVLITCPECKNRHVISDHLKIFSDTSLTIEDLMRQKGELVKRGTIGADGDVEFWDDGTTTKREPEAKL